MNGRIEVLEIKGGKPYEYGQTTFSFYSFLNTNKTFSTTERENLGGFFHFKKASLASREVVLDLSPYEFQEFYIEIQNLTPVNKPDYFEGSDTNDDDYKYSSITKACVLSLLQVEYKDVFTYPLTAYAAVRFSGADFDAPPTRGYHCRGMKIKVPSNYNTREEDAASGGLGVANYNRKIEYNSATNSYTVKKSNILILQ